ncbi:MAG: tRNA lysidine(34) synthetase TilS [Oscillospiraceae bacterium]|nr:tRNA lysidine(34) synthetase TilS [Oscillospiraceae bacterium]
MKIVEQIKNTINSYDMLKCGDSVLVGVSGGADSVCLLYVLHDLRDELNIKLSVAHLNHGLRGADADNDERFVAELCNRLGIKFYSKKVDLLSDNDTVESAGRRARYKFFADLKRAHKFDKIATAHHMDDQAETVIMRIMRGTGISGLGGIQYIRDDGVIRPLLDVSRKEIEEYLRANNIDYRTDSTNSDTEFTRNRIRTELFPYLEASFNPNIKEALCRLVTTAGEDGAFLENYARRLYKRLKNPLPQSEPICLHISSILMVGKPILARLIRIAAEDALGYFPQLENKHIDDILALAGAGKSGSSLDLPHDLRVTVNYDWLTFSKQSEVQMFGAFYLEIEPNGVYEIKKYGVRITARQIAYADYTPEKYDTFVDADKLAGRKLHLRKRQDGDKMAVYADGRTKKVNDIFTDMKIARHHRDRQLILATNDEVIAILGVRVSEKYRADSDTKEGILIRYESLENFDN